MEDQTPPAGPKVVGFSITRSEDAEALTMQRGDLMFILGANGTGKSALVHHVNSTLVTVSPETSAKPTISYLPGGRPVFFQNERLNLSAQGRQQLASNMVSWESGGDLRWRQTGGVERNEKAIHDLQVAEIQTKVAAADRIADDQGDEITSATVATLKAKRSVFDQVNAVLSQANLAVQIRLSSSNEAVAIRGDQELPVSRMSDGERTALILAAEVLTAAADTTFLIDEPEKHLHRSIVVPLLKALIGRRRDCIFLISTHELDLPIEFTDARLLLLRDVRWRSESEPFWIYDLATAEGIPEDLRGAVLGARRKILFIEGDSTSLDQPLYSLIFPGVSLIARGPAREVKKATDSLRSLGGHAHWVQPFGLIDRDGMTPEQMAKSAAGEVYPLSVFAVESLYYCEAAIRAVASRPVPNVSDPETAPSVEVPEQPAQVAVVDGAAVQLAADAGLRAVAAAVDNFAALASERIVRAAFLRERPQRADIQASRHTPMSLDLPDPFDEQKAELEALIGARDIWTIIERYRVRDFGILTAMAQALGFAGRDDYEREMLVCVQSSPRLAEHLRSKFGELSDHLRPD